MGILEISNLRQQIFTIAAVDSVNLSQKKVEKRPSRRDSLSYQNLEFHRCIPWVLVSM